MYENILLLYKLLYKSFNISEKIASVPILLPDDIPGLWLCHTTMVSTPQV